MMISIEKTEAGAACDGNELELQKSLLQLRQALLSLW